MSKGLDMTRRVGGGSYSAAEQLLLGLRSRRPSCGRVFAGYLEVTDDLSLLFLPLSLTPPPPPQRVSCLSFTPPNLISPPFFSLGYLCFCFFFSLLHHERPPEAVNALQMSH